MVVVRGETRADHRAVVGENANLVVVRRDVHQPKPPVDNNPVVVADAANGDVLQERFPLEGNDA